MKISRTPASTTPAMMCSRIGLPCTRSIGLGNSLVSSLIRVPLPAARMTAFTGNDFNHGWTWMNTDFCKKTICVNPRNLPLKLRQFFQFLYALFDVGALDLGRAVQAKTFATERRGDAAIDHRAADVRINRTPGRGEIAHHAADERIARASRVCHRVQRICRADEKSLRP